MKKTSLVVALVAALLCIDIHQCIGFSSSTSHQHSILDHKNINPRYPIKRLVSDAKLSGSRLLSIPSSVPPSLISQSNDWGNIAVLSFAASLAQLLGKTTLVGKLLGAPVTAMALTFVLSSLSIFPSSIRSTANWSTLLPSGGSPSSTFVQTTSLTLATPLLLLGTSIRGQTLKRCGSLLGSFVVASLGTLIGAIVALVITSSSHLLPSLTHTSLPNGDGIKIAAALLAKNIGGGINYMAVCSCLDAAPESVVAGLCVDNVMALAYFPLSSIMASKFNDVDDDGPSEEDSTYQVENDVEEINPIESLSHAFTLAAVLTSLGQFCNSKIHLLRPNSKPLNLSLPITTLLTVLFSTYYPPNWFLSSTSTSISKPSEYCDNSNKLGTRNSLAQSGERVSNHHFTSALLILSFNYLSTLINCVSAWNFAIVSIFCNCWCAWMEA
jgi:hypothetical protein